MSSHKEKKKTNVTLPIGNKFIFDALAEIAYKAEGPGMASGRDNPSKEEFFEHIRQELGSDAFLYSFTPSGEIGDGFNTLDNPRTPRIAKTFYEQIGSILGSNGSVTKFLKKNNPTKRVHKNRMFRFKSAVVNLIQLYLEVGLGYTTIDKVSKKATAQEKSRMRVTSFNYVNRGPNESDESFYPKLIQVEMHRYFRLFVAVVFFSGISKLMLTEIKEMTDSIDEFDLARIKRIDFAESTKDLPEAKKLKLKFAKLRDPENRKLFIDDVIKMWDIQFSAPMVKKKKTKAEQDQEKIEFARRQQAMFEAEKPVTPGIEEESNIKIEPLKKDNAGKEKPKNKNNKNKKK